MAMSLALAFLLALPDSTMPEEAPWETTTGTAEEGWLGSGAETGFLPWVKGSRAWAKSAAVW
jgi:hypothetical protein